MSSYIEPLQARLIRIHIQSFADPPSALFPASSYLAASPPEPFPSLIQPMVTLWRLSSGYPTLTLEALSDIMP